MLVFGDNVILSMLGFLQGDPLAVLLFALDLHPVIVRIKEEVPTLRTNAWFLDDGLLAGQRVEVREAVRIILEEGLRRGLHLSTGSQCQETQSPPYGCLSQPGLRTPWGWESSP